MQPSLTNQLNTFITDNPSLFEAGNVLSYSDLARHVGHIFPRIVGIEPSLRTQCHFVTAYTRLNKLLKYRGIQIKAEDYYSRFRILDIDETLKKARHMSRKASALRYASRVTTKAVNTQRQTWTQLTLEELEAVEPGIHSSYTRVPY